MCHHVVSHYYRQDHFDFYRRYRTPFYDVTVPFDITALRAYARATKTSLYLNLCYYFTRAAASIEDFRYRYLDDQVVLYQRLHPGVTVPAPNGCFSFANLRYDERCARFHQRARAAVDQAEQAVTLVESEHHNYLYFTALPTVPFEAFSHAPSNESTDAEPKVAFGRYRDDGARLVVPTAIQVNHAFIDGRALGELVTAVQRAFDQPDR